MNLKRIKNTICAALLAATMILPGITAYADEVRYVNGSPVATDSQILSSDKATGIIKKNVVSERKSVTYNRNFSYSITQEAQNKDDSGTTANETLVALSANPITLNQTGTSGTQDNDTKNYRLSGSTDIDLSGITTVGVYTYIIKENAASATDGTDNYTWDYDQTQYRLRVYVEDVGGDELVKTITLERITDRDGNPLTTGEKVTSADFDNYVIGKFRISKVLDDPLGTHADGTFTFNVGVGVLDALKDYVELPSTIKYNIVTTNADGSETIVQENQTLTLGTTPFKDGKVSYGYGTISIKAGQTIVLTNLPDGAVVSVAEVDHTGTKTVKTTEHRSNQEDDKTKEEDYKTNVQVTQDTRLTFTNTYEGAVLTGVVTDIAPYVTLVVVAAAAVIAYIVFKNKMR